MAYVPREEQEVIISYDRELDEWHYYGDVPHLNRKWRNQIEAEREISEEGILRVLEGKILGSVNINKRPKMTDVQKKANTERIKRAKINSFSSSLDNSAD